VSDGTGGARLRALLISNSGAPFLEHCRGAITEFLGVRRRVAFVTAASLGDAAAYHARAREALPALEVLHLRWDVEPLETLEAAEALFVGGGNTYALLKRLRAGRLLEPIGAKLLEGMPYVGSSAGSNIAGPNILTTNDWNVVALDRFDALGVVPFNINPHYLETDPALAPGSETREMRIAEYHAVHANPVVGIEEGTLLRVVGAAATVAGRGRVKLFERGQAPRWFAADEQLPLHA